MLSQQRFQHTEGQKSEMKQAASQAPKTTAQTWFQPKRIPLYIAVAGGLIGAATFFWTKQATHPQVETSKHIRYPCSASPSNHPRPFSPQQGFAFRNSEAILGRPVMDQHVPERSDSRLSVANCSVSRIAVVHFRRSILAFLAARYSPDILAKTPRARCTPVLHEGLGS